MDLENKKSLADLEDRDLLELIFTATVTISRRLDRIETHLQTVDKEYLKKFDESIEDSIQKIIDNYSDTEHALSRILNE